MIEKIFSSKLVFFLTLALSVVAFYLSFSNNLILTYNDAASHLNISRRVLDNLTPGIAQIGTVWLPLPHLFMLPLAANDYLWKTGFAGSIVSMGAFIVSVVFVYKTIFLITQSRFGSFIGAAIMATNPNLLYLQTTPMTEPLLIATFVLAIFYLARYVTYFKVIDLLLASVSVMASTLIRYDGWFLFVSLLILLPLWIIFLKGRAQAEGAFLLFATLGGFGIAAWVAWNWMIFGDPLYFITGPYSAYAQQQVLKSVGQLPTEGNLYNAFYYYLWAMIANNGLYIFGAAAISALTVPFIINNKKNLIVYFAAASPIIFNVIALYLGQSAMNVPQAPSNPGMFNIRYGLMALPFIALALGTVSKYKIGAALVAVVLIFQLFNFYRAGHPVALADGLYGLSQTYYTVEASSWLRQNYKGGLILTSLASHDAFVARTKLDMENYIHEGTRNYWDEALKGPGENVKYIATLSFPPDLVYRAISKNEEFKKKYKLVHNYKKFEIYERIE